VPLDQPDSTEPTFEQVRSGALKGLADIPLTIGQAIQDQFPRGTASKDIEEASPVWGPWAIDYYRNMRSWANKSQGPIEDVSRLAPAAATMYLTRGRSAPEFIPTLARALGSAGLGALLGSQHGGYGYTGGAVGGGVGLLSSLMRLNPTTLAVLAAELYRNPQVRQFFGSGPQGASSASVANPSDPNSIDNIHKRQNADQQKLDTQMQQLKQENDNYEDHGPGGDPATSPIPPNPQEPESQ
jgi:hypothetical protein